MRASAEEGSGSRRERGGGGREWKTEHREEGGEGEVGQSASVDPHHLTAEPDTQVSLHIFRSSISRISCASSQF